MNIQIYKYGYSKFCPFGLDSNPNPGKIFSLLSKLLSDHIFMDIRIYKYGYSKSCSFGLDSNQACKRFVLI